MKKVIHLNENHLKRIIEKVIQESEKNKNFIKKAVEKQKNEGTNGRFGQWCKRNGLASEDGEVTMKCINKAMKSDDPKVVKMANFAKNIGGYKGSQREMKEDLDPIELELDKSYKYMHTDPTKRDKMEYQGSEQDLGSFNPDSKIYKFKFKKGSGSMVFTDVTPVQP